MGNKKMIKAIDKSGAKVSIDHADKNEHYYCPVCGQILIQKRGQVRMHHFSHIGERGGYEKGYVPCSDKWNYDKSDWHIEWQKKFPEESYETVVEFEGKKHIADVLIGDIVIEFQYSNITIEEFRERNEFYTKCGYKVIWVFNVFEDFWEEKIVSDDFDENKYHWTYVKKLFREMEVCNEKALIFFQSSYMEVDFEEKKCIMKVKNSYKGFKLFYVDSKFCLRIDEFVEKVLNNPEYFFAKKEITKPNDNQIAAIKAHGGKSVYELWNKDYKWMIIRNLSNGKEMLINGTNGKMNRSGDSYGGKIVGKFSNKNYNGNYNYSEKEYVVFDADKPIWQMKCSSADKEKN